jgi:hypothetical protein
MNVLETKMFRSTSQKYLAYAGVVVVNATVAGLPDVKSKIFDCYKMLFVQTFFQHTVKLCIVHTIMPPFC